MPRQRRHPPIDKDGEIEIFDNPITNEVLSENHYYPFGMMMNEGWMSSTRKATNYQFNGKELNEDFGLNLYEYGARWYDPAIGRFTGVDPISDQFPWVSTFNYAENSPVDGIDLWGLQYIRFDKIDDIGNNLISYYHNQGNINLPVVEYNGNNYYNLGFHINDNEGNQLTEWIYNSVGPVISESNFVGWGDQVNGSTCDDCFSCCNIQMDLAGVTSTGPYDRVQIYGANGVADDATVQEGLDYIHRALEANNPIRVGLDYGETGTNNVDGITDHFVTIVDRGYDGSREYFRFFENGVGRGTFGSSGRPGASGDNRLYINADGTISGTSTWSGSRVMTVTMVRPNTDQ